MEDGVQGFLDNVTRVVGSRKDPTVICVVHSEAGLELLFNTNDMVMKSMFNSTHGDQAKSDGDAVESVGGVWGG